MLECCPYRKRGCFSLRTFPSFDAAYIIQFRHAFELPKVVLYDLAVQGKATALGKYASYF